MYENLIATIAIRKVAKTKIAADLEIDRSTLENKLRGRSHFTVAEMFFIHAKYFPDTDANKLFECSSIA